MAAKLEKFDDLFYFHCPGCGHSHPFDQRWTWNGSMESPTFTPSLLVFKDFPELRCHSFVTDGKIQFLSDCHHSMAGQTVEIPDWDEPEWDSFDREAAV